MNRTEIAWTEITWNPVTGCDKFSEGCWNCYAEKMASRLKSMGIGKYRNGFAVTLHEDALQEPSKWSGSRLVFVCSMADLFHEKVPYEFIDNVMSEIKGTPQHTYQILTKRAERMMEYFSSREVPGNAMLGVTLESDRHKRRVDCLKKIKCGGTKFLSCEPLLGNLGRLDLSGIGWVIVGGESGTDARHVRKEWVLDIRRQCEEWGTAFFFKQWGTWGEDGVRRNKKANGCLLDGEVVQEYPPQLQKCC